MNLVKGAFYDFKFKEPRPNENGNLYQHEYAEYLGEEGEEYILRTVIGVERFKKDEFAEITLLDPPPESSA